MRGAARVGLSGGGASGSFGAVRTAYKHDTAKQGEVRAESGEVRAESGMVSVVGFAGCLIVACLCVCLCCLLFVF